MSSHYGEMYGDNLSQRSHGSSNLNGGNPNGNSIYNTVSGGLNRQTSRQFEQPARQYQHSSVYGDEDRMMSYESRTFDRSSMLPQQYGSQYNGAGTFDPPNLWANNNSSYSSATVGASSRMRPPQASRRAMLPSHWPNESNQSSQYGMPPPSQIPNMNGYSNGHTNGMHGGLEGQLQPASSDTAEDEDLIPTAIVIKNIPFAVKREQLASMMSDMGLPAPYAFNYHFDGGVFRGLAFANFQNPNDTARVIAAMNHMDLQGRKLRVEYKKMLPQHERERIERTKREKRGQLEEQHRPITEQPRGLSLQPSYSSLSSPVPQQSQSPSPVSFRGGNQGSAGNDRQALAGRVDFNDVFTLDAYTEMVIFKKDDSRQIHQWTPGMSDHERRTVHEIAQQMGFWHETLGMGDLKYVRLNKTNPARLMASTEQLGTGVNYAAGGNRHGLSRAATTDFTAERDPQNPALRSQASAFLQPYQENGFHAQSLRGAKSFGDLQRHPSPANSQQSFDPSLAANVSRFTSNGYSNGNLSSTNVNATARATRDDLTTSFGGLSLAGINQASQPRLAPIGSSASAIGSHRVANGLNGSYEDPQRATRTITSRQPRGPSDWSNPSGFTHRQRGSNDLDNESADSLDSPVSGPLSSRFTQSRN